MHVVLRRPRCGHTAAVVSTAPATMNDSGYPALTQTITRSLAPLRQSQAATMQGFGAMAKAAMADGALSEKHKELIALGIAVSARCAGCIGFHVKALQRLGATRAEFEETLGVAVYMGGGPSLMYAAEAMQAWEQFGT
jgi:AhpD family alkylhydroperoxidase